VACFCEHGNEYSVFMKAGNLFTRWVTASLSRYAVLRRDEVLQTCSAYFVCLDVSPVIFSDTRNVPRFINM
jgi:hypothetical protein